jgi:RTX calcium-binding nonapeptide repeat (4 copies)
VVTVNADTNVNNVNLAVVGQFIVVSTDETPETACIGSGTFALTTNTNRIQVFVNVNLEGFRSPVAYTVDQSRGTFEGGSPEADGTSEVETTIFTNAPSSTLTLFGTAQRDVFTVGGNSPTEVNYGADSDIDLTITSASSSIRVLPGDGDDFVSGQGNPGGSSGATTASMNVSGGIGKDTIFGGARHDTIRGGPDNDILRTSGGGSDSVDGETGFDDAVVDPTDTPVTSIEALHKVGRLRLAPRVLRARAGTPSRLTMSWKHPKAWRELAALDVGLYRGAKRVGNVAINPRAGRLTGSGLAEVAKGSGVTHHAKTVSARLALRFPRSLAGQDLRVDVRATDTHGHHQTERSAGTIRVAG